MTTSSPRRICLIVNTGSGRIKREPAALETIERALNGCSETRRVAKGKDLEKVARSACEDGFDVIVPVGGDGTIMTVAGAIADTGCAIGIVPMGTFNYFARGLGIPEDLEAASAILLSGTPRPISLGSVNDRMFLNNASVGVYPRILRERESVYRRFGRHRIAAYWSVIKTFFRFQRPLRLTLDPGDAPEAFRTPLLFVARSAFQIEEYQLEGSACVRKDRFAVYISPDGNRWDLFRQAWRLIRRNMQIGEDFHLRCHDDFTVDTGRKHALVACDGEKFVMETPLRFSMRRDILKVVTPPEDA